MIKVPELPEASDESEEPNLEWFVLKVQSGREDTIRDGIVRRIKMEGLDRYFDQVVVPTEKSTEIRNNKKKIVERKGFRVVENLIKKGKCSFCGTLIPGVWSV